MSVSIASNVSHVKLAIIWILLVVTVCPVLAIVVYVRELIIVVSVSWVTMLKLVRVIGVHPSVCLVAV